MGKRINSLFITASMIISATAFALPPEAPVSTSNLSYVAGDSNSIESVSSGQIEGTGEVEGMGEVEDESQGESEGTYSSGWGYAPRSPRASYACRRLRYAACYNSLSCYPNIDPDSGNFLGCVPG